jgi:hypothetical protein
VIPASRSEYCDGSPTFKLIPNGRPGEPLSKQDVKAMMRRSSDMKAEIQLPKAFSLQNEDEFFPFQHLLARMNPKLMVVEVATGMHKNGGRTVFWGLAFLEGQLITRQELEDSLAEAGFDFSRGKIQNVPFVVERAAAG